MCNILVSACLLGVNCRYNAVPKKNEEIVRLLDKKGIHLIPVCPEQLGGLATPRCPAERKGEQIINAAGEDVTEQYLRGARETLRIAQMYHCRLALLKERSPSCGCGQIYDGTFSGTLTEGDGATAALLRENGIEVFGESEAGQLMEGMNKNKTIYTKCINCDKM